ncbi:antibiotic biosynthesis monooxygenase family protein [Alteromonas sp. ASW11-130]|uniref:antibiotic biosynthesis monooxygenase family protein n=1 Tax=Alteromonas sp. ASW11-130 TaxID=3015775 RepID=UPI002241F825|nr:antibiotic biosynthesis monooxygenase [Alteromonas sp. ASW11-130]MCW8090493.1 antibiotic biosynthesis monooxygenase [Alteromonas sp. ASW11-130]
MFVVMFEFVVKAGCEEQFLSAWPKTTQGIFLFKGSLGSRLHRDKNGSFIAYAQWPDEETYRHASEIEMSTEYEKQRQLMRESLNLESTKTLYEMEVEIDYLHRRSFDV